MAKYRFDQIAINSTEKKKPVEEDRFTYLGLEHLDSGTLKVTRFGSEIAPIGEKLVMHKGDVLFGKRRAYQKKVVIAPFDGIFSAHGMVLRPKEEVIDKDFFPLFISSDYFLDAAIKISVGSLSPTINWRDLKELEFELPDMDTQRKLAEVLWSINDTMEAYKKLISATDELVKSQFMEQFGNPITNDRGWDYVLLPELTEFVLGTTPKSSEPEYWDGDIKWITPAELEDTSFVIYDSVRHITEAGVKAAGLKSFPAGTVIFSTRAPIGKTAIAGCEMYCNQGFKNFICGPRLNPVYLFALLRMNKDYFVGLGTGATFKELSKARLEKIAISVPPIELQEQFEEFYKQSDKSKYHTSKTTMLNTEIETIVKEGFFLARKEKTFAAYLEDQNYDSMFKRFKLISQGNGQAGTEIGEKFTLSPKSCSPTDCLNSRNSGSYQG